MTRKLAALTIFGGFIILLVNMALAPPAFAIDRNWTPYPGETQYWDYYNGAGSYFYTSIYQTGEPLSGDNVTFFSNNNYDRTGAVRLANEVCNNFVFTTTAGYTYKRTLNIGAGSLTVYGNIYETNTPQSYLNITGGSLYLAGSGVSSVDNFSLTSGALWMTGTGTFTNSITNGAGTVYINSTSTYTSALGATINVAAFNVGYSAAGTFNLSGTQALTAPTESLGTFNGTNTFTQSGTSTNTVSGTLTMGYGTYNLNGGTLSVGTIADGTGTGTFNVDGGTLTLGTSAAVENFNVGKAATGTFTLGANKSLTAPTQYVGESQAADSTFTQNNGSGYSNTATNLTIGRGYYHLRGGTLSVNQVLNGAGTGYLLVDGGTLALGSSVVVEQFHVGNLLTGAFTLGTGKSISANLVGVGGNSTGTLTQTDGTDSSTNLQVGINSGSTGTYTQSGGTNTTQTLDIGKNSGSNGTYNLNGGTLTATTITRGAGTSAFNATGGRLSVGTFNGNLTMSSGSTLAPGSSPGLTTVNGNFSNSGTIEFELGGTVRGGTGNDGYDAIDVNGTTALGGTLQLKPWNGYAPTVGTVFALVKSTGAITYTGSLDTSAFTGLSGTWTPTVSGLESGFYYYRVTYDYATYAWNSSSGTWSETTKWNPNGTPTVDNNVTVNNSGTVNVTGTANAKDLTLGAGTINVNTGGTLNAASIVNTPSVTGTINMDGGTLNVTASTIDVDNFNVGYAASTNGSFTLASGKAITATTERIGSSGTGTLTQTGGTNTAGTTYVGQLAGGNGTYTQSGGTNTVTGYLDVGYNATATGNYNLSGTGYLDSTGAGSVERIGAYGTGTFTQTGGTNAARLLYIGRLSGSNGTYDQSAGTTSVSTSLVLGYDLGATGSYTLSDTGELNVNTGTAYEYIGYNGTGTFTQTGGANSVYNLYVGANSGSDGTYTQSGGTTAIVGAAFSVGHSAGAVGNYSLSGTGLLDVTNIIESVGNYGEGTFTQTGGTNNAKNIYVGRYVGSEGTYNHSAGTVTVSSFLTLGVGLVDVGGGTGAYNLSGTGLLDVSGAGAAETIGYYGTGTFTQTGGSNTSNIIYVGYQDGSNGTYNQSAGTTTLTNYLRVGSGAGSTGAYNLSGTGILDASGLQEIVGNAGTGTFTQTGGTNTAKNLHVGSAATGNGTYTQSAGTTTITHYFNVGYSAGSVGNYYLSDTGILDVAEGLDAYERIGYDGTGTFTQTGGTNTTKTMYMGYSATGVGTYYLNGGALSVETIVNGTGTSTLDIDGGTITASGAIAADTLTYDSGTINYSDIDVGTANINHDLDIGTGNTVNATYMRVAGSSGSNAELNITDGTYSGGSMDLGYSGTGVITQSGGSVTLTDDLKLGREATGNGTYNMSGGTLNITGVSAGLDVGHLGTGTFNQSGGTVTIANNLYLGLTDISNSNYYLSGTGQLNAERLVLGNGSTGTFTQTGGEATFSQVYMGLQPAGNAIYNLNGGTLSVASFEPNGAGTSTINVNGGTLTVNGGAGTIIADTLTYNSGTMNYSTIDVATANIHNAMEVTTGQSVTATTLMDITNTLTVSGGTVGGGNMTVNTGATVQGYGTFTNTGTATVNGKVIADGGGVETTLDMSSFTAMANTTPNTTDNGYYVIDKGKLNFSMMEVASGNNTYVVGGDMSLVNSLQFEFYNVLVGDQILVSLVDPTRSDVPQGPVPFLNRWEFTPQNDTFAWAPEGGYFDVTFHYDPANGTQFWEGHAGVYTPSVIVSRDMEHNLITTRYYGFSSGSQTVPEIPAGVALPLLALLGGAMVIFKKRIFAPAKKK